MTNWPTVPFSQFLRPNLRPYTLGPEEDANLVGMRLYGEGPFHRELKPAIRIAKKSHFIIKAGDVIYNKLFAWKGTFGIVPPELDGMFVSDKFPTYELDRSIVDANYLRWFFRFPPLWDEARTMSTGSAALSKLTLNPPKFLLLTMPLPTIEDQRRIASRIEKLAAKHEEAHLVRVQTNGRAGALFRAALDVALKQLSQKYENRMLIDLVQQDRGISYGVVLTGAPDESGVPTLRAGDLQHFRVLLSNVKKISPAIAGKYQRTRLRGEELLLRIRGGLGEVAVCPPAMIGGNVSREIAVIPFTQRVLPKFGMYALAAPSIQSKMTSHLRGTSYQGINLKDVRTLLIPVPPTAAQAKVIAHFDNLRTKIDAVSALQLETSKELGALIPSILAKAFHGEL